MKTILTSTNFEISNNRLTMRQGILEEALPEKQGIKQYHKFIGIILGCLGFAAQLKIRDKITGKVKIHYVNVNSYKKWLARENRHYGFNTPLTLDLLIEAVAKSKKSKASPKDSSPSEKKEVVQPSQEHEALKSIPSPVQALPEESPVKAAIINPEEPPLVDERPEWMKILATIPPIIESEPASFKLALDKIGEAWEHESNISLINVNEHNQIEWTQEEDFIKPTETKFKDLIALEAFCELFCRENCGWRTDTKTLFVATWIAKRSTWILKQCYGQETVQGSLLGRGLAHYLPKKNLPFMMGVLALHLPEAAKGLMLGWIGRLDEEPAALSEQALLELEERIESCHLNPLEKKYATFEKAYEDKGTSLLRLQKEVFELFRKDPHHTRCIEVHARIFEIFSENKEHFLKREIAHQLIIIGNIKKKLKEIEIKKSEDLGSQLAGIFELKRALEKLPKRWSEGEIQEIYDRSEHLGKEIDELLDRVFKKYTSDTHREIQKISDEAKQALEQPDVGDKKVLYEKAAEALSSLEEGAETILSYTGAVDDRAVDLRQITNKISLQDSALRKLCGLPEAKKW